LRRSFRSLDRRRAKRKADPDNQARRRIGAAGLRERRLAASPTTPRGDAHRRWGAPSASRIAPVGRMKLSDVATQIQYFVVALPRGIEVRSQAQTPTAEANRRWMFV
jgi:hypothetical protein